MGNQSHPEAPIPRPFFQKGCGALRLVVCARLGIAPGLCIIANIMSSDPTIRRSARDRAVKALVESYHGEVFCHDLLETWQSADPLSPADTALAAELTIGVSRHRLTCEHIAARFYRGRWAGLRLPIRVILALGVYQLCWLDRIPDHAVVDQAVRQARRLGRGTASIVNAVLRQVARCRTRIAPPPNAPDARRYLPLDERRGCLFSENIFPDPARRPLEHLVAVTSHPPWLVERWHRRFKPAVCRQICDAGSRRPPLVLRPNVRRTGAATLLRRLTEAGHAADLIDDNRAVCLHGPTCASDLAEIREGLCQPQDATAQTALRLSPPRPGDLVVDLCAGVGTKTTQAAEMMDDRGTVIATDANESKLASISSAAERLGLTIIQPTPMHQLDAAIARAGKPPDVILVDAPCLNTGVLARRPEARYRASQKNLQEIVDIQAGLLRQAIEMTGQHTRIIYSTCSLEVEENENQVQAFCAALAEWQSLKQAFTLPDQTRDGGFAAVLVRE